MKYDGIVVGGGVAGSAFAHAMASRGARVLVVEKETAFRDRVRGEGIHPWGVAELRRLGLETAVLASAGEPAPLWKTHVGGLPMFERALADSQAGAPGVNAHHPELQEALLAAAAVAGAEVRRGTSVDAVTSGDTCSVTLRGVTGAETVSAPWVVVADGRDSRLARALGFTVEEEPTPVLVSGVLLDGVSGARNVICVYFPREFGAAALYFPLPRGRARVYLAAHQRSTESARFSSAADLPDFLAACRRLSLPASWLENARAGGPLATFQTPARFVRVPSRAGIVLLGDAAGNVDPALGCGLSLAFRDARVLSDALAAGTNRDAALAAYVDARSTYYRSLLRVESWVRRVLYTPGSEGDQIRARAFGPMRELGIDVACAGPESPSDAATERALFG